MQPSTRPVMDEILELFLEKHGESVSYKLVEDSEVVNFAQLQYIRGLEAIRDS